MWKYKYQLISYWFRVGHHSTSDDSTAYRSIEEVNEWTKNDYPINRFRAYLEIKGYWDAEAEQKFLEESKKNVLKAFSDAEKKPKPAWTEMFNDVYKNKPNHIRYILLLYYCHIHVVCS